jgi:ribosome biogenesis GTPase
VFELEAWGWSPHWDGELERWRASHDAAPDLEPARVVGLQRDLWRLQVAAGELHGRVRGALRHRATAHAALPAVGDWVMVRARPGEGQAAIHAVLPRRSKLSRQEAGRATAEQVLAANVDRIALVQSLNHDLNLRRLERSLTAVWDSGAQPLVVLNKLDLCADPEPLQRAVEAAAAGVPVLVLSAHTGVGVPALEAHLAPGQTLVLIGTSGVGKSTLVNLLLGEARQRVHEIRAGDDRGRHTTTSRQLFRLPAGGLLVDTPGLRLFGLWDRDGGLERAFEDLTQLAAECRFHDCRHEHEPGCAVRAAVQDGRLDAGRLESHRKLRRELAYQERKVDVLKRIEETRRWKAIHKSMRRPPRPR